MRQSDGEFIARVVNHRRIRALDGGRSALENAPHARNRSPRSIRTLQLMKPSTRAFIAGSQHALSYCGKHASAVRTERIGKCKQRPIDPSIGLVPALHVATHRAMEPVDSILGNLGNVG
jgi:hypothetical protein